MWNLVRNKEISINVRIQNDRINKLMILTMCCVFWFYVVDGLVSLGVIY